MSLPGVFTGRYRVTTDPLRSERKVELAVVLLALVLCLQLLYSGARLLMSSAPAAIAPAADALNVRQFLSAEQVTQEQRNEIVARPLFWESRRPLDETAVAVEEDVSRGKVGKLKGVKLLGVFGSGDMAGIIVQVKDKKRRILSGEEINGWTLQRVEPNRVVFTAKGRTSELVLRAAAVVAQSPEAAATTSAPLRDRPAVRKRPAARNPPAAASDGAQDELSLGGSSG